VGRMQHRAIMMAVTQIFLIEDIERSPLKFDLDCIVYDRYSFYKPPWGIEKGTYTADYCRKNSFVL
jgi:hypothetical protein